MTLQQIKTQIANFGTKKQQQIEEYQTLKKDLFSKVQNQQMYQSEAELRLQNFKSDAESYSDSEYKDIINKLDQIEKAELEVIKSEYETVTSDNVAELNLLGSMKVSESELLNYLEKYKRNPLAVKKLHNIASDNNIALPGYILKEDRLAEMIKVFKSYAANYANAPVIDNAGAASDLAFTLVLASDELGELLDSYTNHFDTALGLSEG